MPPEADRRSAIRSSLWVTGIACPVVLVIIVGILWAAFGDADQRQHYLGQSTHTRATVADDVEDGWCSGGVKRRQHAYTLEWSEGGEQRTEVIQRCGTPYDVGEEIEIWSTDGMPYTESALVWQVLVGSLVLVMGALFVLMLWLHLALRRRARAP